MLENTFDYGQVYVALSRVKSLAGLWLSKPIQARTIKAHPEVLKFYGLEGKKASSASRSQQELPPVAGGETETVVEAKAEVVTEVAGGAEKKPWERRKPVTVTVDAGQGAETKRAAKAPAGSASAPVPAAASAAVPVKKAWARKATDAPVAVAVSVVPARHKSTDFPADGTVAQQAASRATAHAPVVDTIPVVKPNKTAAKATPVLTSKPPSARKR